MLNYLISIFEILNNVYYISVLKSCMINRINHTAILLATIVAITLMAGCTGNGGTGSPVPTPASTVTGSVVSITLTGQNMAFDAKTLTAPAGSTVVMTFANKDTNIPHNFALYTDTTAMTKIFAGDLVTGPKIVTYTFTAPSIAGNYFFRCDAHPQLMTGTFIVT